MLKGLWYWTGDIGAAIRLALDIGANTMILKAAYHDPVFTGPLKLRQDFPRNAAKCRAAGLLVAAEVFSLPRTADQEGRALAAAVRAHGAASAVVNAETPHEDDDGSGVARLVHAFGAAAPLFACTDFRGDRLTRPYHAQLAKHVAGWLPMCYPRSFYPDQPFGDLQRAFDDVYWRWNQLGPALPRPGRDAPTMPVIQAYGGLDYEEAAGQLLLGWRWGAAGASVYASHDVNDRAKWGVRDAWLAWDTILRAPPDGAAVAAAAAGGARDAVLHFYAAAINQR